MNYRRLTATALEQIRQASGGARLARKDVGMLAIGGRLVRIEEQVKLAKAAYVHACREDGHTWAEIAEQLGTTRQNVQQTYGQQLVDRPLKP